MVESNRRSRRTYARVTDGLSSHAKVTRIPRSVRAEALGTWVLALSWSNEHLTDGYLPAHQPEELGGTAAGVEALIAAGLWRRSRQGGVQFVNWAEHQSTRQEVEHAREQNRRRQERFRAKPAEQPELPGLGDDDITRDETATNAPSQSQSATRSQTPTPGTGLTDKTPGTQPSRGRASSPQGDGSVDIERVRLRLVQLAAGYDPDHPGDMSTERVQIAIAHVLGKKRGSPPVNPTAYVLASLTSDPGGWERFAYEGRLPT